MSQILFNATAHVQERTQEHAALDDIHLQTKTCPENTCIKSVLVESAGAQVCDSVNNHGDKKEMINA